jgi:hypothetical protein
MAAPGAASKYGAGHTLKPTAHNVPTMPAESEPLTLISAIAAAMLFALDRPIRRIEAARAADIIALNATTQPEPA